MLDKAKNASAWVMSLIAGNVLNWIAGVGLVGCVGYVIRFFGQVSDMAEEYGMTFAACLVGMYLAGVATMLAASYMKSDARVMKQRIKLLSDTDKALLLYAYECEDAFETPEGRDDDYEYLARMKAVVAFKRNQFRRITHWKISQAAKDLLNRSPMLLRDMRKADERVLGKRVE